MAMAKTFVTWRATSRLRCSSSYTIDEYALAKSSIFIKEYVIESHKKRASIYISYGLSYKEQTMSS
jgi:hypothetical protein